MNKLKWLLLICWVTGISAVVGYMHSWHLVDLSPKNQSKISIESFSSDVKNFGVIHFLTPACSCSQSILDHLLKRAPIDIERAKEAVVLFDDSKDQMKSKLLKNGYQVFSLDSKEINKENEGAIRGVPLLVIYDKDKITKYVGGYSDKAITPFTEINISEYLKSIEMGKKLATNPVIGCAVSNEYKKLLDPFGLKYTEISNDKI